MPHETLCFMQIPTQGSTKTPFVSLGVHVQIGRFERAWIAGTGVVVREVIVFDIQNAAIAASMPRNVIATGAAATGTTPACQLADGSGSQAKQQQE